MPGCLDRNWYCRNPDELFVPASHLDHCEDQNKLNFWLWFGFWGEWLWVGHIFSGCAFGSSCGPSAGQRLKRHRALGTDEFLSHCSLARHQLATKSSLRKNRKNRLSLHER
jgi:hypothetical protein